MIPSILKDFNTFFNGNNWIGLADEVVLTKLSKKLEEIYMGNGPVSVAMGNEALELECSLNGYSQELIDSFGACGVSDVALRFAGAHERQDATCETMSIDVIVRGRLSEFDLGTAKKGDKHQYKFKMSLAYIKVLVDNEERIEIDHENYIERVGGVDRLAATRAAIGL